MASLRSGLLSSRAMALAATRPMLPLTRQLERLRITSNGASVSSLVSAFSSSSSSSSSSRTTPQQQQRPRQQARYSSTTAARRAISSGGNNVENGGTIPGTIFHEGDLGDLSDLMESDALLASDLLDAAYGDGGNGSNSGSGGSGDGRDGELAVASRHRDTAPLPKYARLLPASPSYFSRQPHFNESFLRLQALFEKYGGLPTAPAEEVEPVAWRRRRDFRVINGEDVSAPTFNKCIAMAKHLHKIHPTLKPPIVTEALAEFRRTINPFAHVRRVPTVDRFGRAIGVGRRKTSVARAWVVEGTGEMLVNGKTLAHTFGRVHDRTSATWALRATERLDKYNVWALVEGGGTTGQAEALTMAVANGLVVHEPALKTALRKAGCIARDPRMVERKKHDRLKARKSPTWVKR